MVVKIYSEKKLYPSLFFKPVYVGRIARSSLR